MPVMPDDESLDFPETGASCYIPCKIERQNVSSRFGRILRLPMKAGWTSTVQVWSRLHRKRSNIRSNLRWSHRNAGLACRRSRLPNHPASLGRPAETQTHLARLRGSRQGAHPRVRPAMVPGWRTLLSRNCAAAVEFWSPNTIREIEEYQVELSDVTVLELVIVSDRSRGVAHASLKSLRLS